MTDLQEIDNVGPSYAEQLQDHGYDTAESVATADESDIDDILDHFDGETIVENASDVVNVDDTTTVDDDGDVRYEFDPGFDADQRNHLVAALINEEVDARRRNQSDTKDSVTNAIEQVVDGPPYHFTMDQLDIAYRATNQLTSEYRGTRGIGSFTTKIKNMSDALNEKRQEHWDDE